MCDVVYICGINPVRYRFLYFFVLQLYIFTSPFPQGDGFFYVRWCEIVHFSNTRFQPKATAAVTVRVLPVVDRRGIGR